MMDVAMEELSAWYTLLGFLNTKVRRLGYKCLRVVDSKKVVHCGEEGDGRLLAKDP